MKKDQIIVIFFKFIDFCQDWKLWLLAPGVKKNLDTPLNTLRHTPTSQPYTAELDAPSLHNATEIVQLIACTIFNFYTWPDIIVSGWSKDGEREDKCNENFNQTFIHFNVYLPTMLMEYDAV